MRPLQPSERRLLLIFSVLLGVTVLYVGGGAFWQWTERSQDERARLKGDRQVAEAWLEQQELWEERSRWLGENLPVFASREDAVGKLPSEMKRLAEENGLQVLEQGFTEDRAGDPVSFAGVRLRVVGGMPQLVRWLHALQQPDRFNRVASIQIEPGEPETNVRCEIKVIHYFTLKANSG
jgi:hypothetical protein